MLGGGLVAAVLWGLREGKTGLLRGGVKLAAVAVVFLVILAVVQKSGFSLRGVPVLGRLAMIVPVGEKTGDIFRSSLWGEVPSLAGGLRRLFFPMEPVIRMPGGGCGWDTDRIRSRPFCPRGGCIFPSGRDRSLK